MKKRRTKTLLIQLQAKVQLIGTRFIFSPERTEKLEKHKMAVQDIGHQAMKEHDL